MPHFSFTSRLARPSVLLRSFTMSMMMACGMSSKMLMIKMSNSLIPSLRLLRELLSERMFLGLMFSIVLYF